MARTAREGSLAAAQGVEAGQRDTGAESASRRAKAVLRSSGEEQHRSAAHDRSAEE